MPISYILIVYVVTKIEATKMSVRVFAQIKYDLSPVWLIQPMASRDLTATPLKFDRSAACQTCLIGNAASATHALSLRRGGRLV